MLCKQCGFSLSSHANFCPGCGNKITEEDRQKGLEQKHPAKWFKALFGLILAGLVLSIFLILFSDHLTEVVSDQLQAIKENRVTEAYYRYTSKPFQKATSLESFRQFIHSYPIFSQHKSVRFIDRESNEDIGSLQAMVLTEQGNEIPVEYQLVKEGDKWLIEHIKLDDSYLEESPAVRDTDEVFDSGPLKSSINGLMGQIRLGNLTKAYRDYTSQDFQKTTPFAEFEEFLKVNPSFSGGQVLEFTDLTFDNNIGTMKGVMIGSDGKRLGVEYDLIEEDGAWKIFHVKMYHLEDQSLASELQFTKFVLGAEIDGNNLVKAPKKVFKDGSEEIYLNLYISNIKSGTTVEVVFEHVDTGSRIAPVSKVVSDDGDVILTFVFSPPDSGWPKGNYRLLASSSTGKSSSYFFTVEG